MKRGFDSDAIIRRHFPDLYRGCVDIEPIGPATWVVRSGGVDWMCDIEPNSDPVEARCAKADREARVTLERIEWLEEVTQTDALDALHIMPVCIEWGDGSVWRGGDVFLTCEERDGLYKLHWSRATIPATWAPVPEHVALDDITEWIAEAILTEENEP